MTIKESLKMLKMDEKEKIDLVPSTLLCGEVFANPRTGGFH